MLITPYSELTYAMYHTLGFDRQINQGYFSQSIEEAKWLHIYVSLFVSVSKITL